MTAHYNIVFIAEFIIISRNLDLLKTLNPGIAPYGGRLECNGHHIRVQRIKKPLFTQNCYVSCWFDAKNPNFVFFECKSDRKHLKYIGSIDMLHNDKNIQHRISWLRKNENHHFSPSDQYKSPRLSMFKGYLMRWARIWCLFDADSAGSMRYDNAPIFIVPSSSTINTRKAPPNIK